MCDSLLDDKKRQVPQSIPSALLTPRAHVLWAGSERETGQKRWRWILALTSVGRNKGAVQWRKSLNAWKSRRTVWKLYILCWMLFRAAWRWRGVGMVGPIDSLVLPPGRMCTSFPADYMEVWYVTQPSLRFLVHIDWDLGPESISIWVFRCGLCDFSWVLFDFCRMRIWFLCRFHFVLDLQRGRYLCWCWLSLFSS